MQNGPHPGTDTNTDADIAPAPPAALPRITLASASPRRGEILARLGVEFVVVAADAPEESITIADIEKTFDPHERCRRVTLERARLKAAAVSPDPSTRLALAADTTVDAGGVILDKPADEQEARFMLSLLAGTTHQVHTAVIVYDDPRDPARRLEEIVTSHVTFRTLSPEDLEWYFSTPIGINGDNGRPRGGQPRGDRPRFPTEPEWRGVAGGYRIQGRAGAFVQHLQGSYEAVMGLPIHTVYSMIRRFCTGFVD